MKKAGRNKGIRLLTGIIIGIVVLQTILQKSALSFRIPLYLPFTLRLNHQEIVLAPGEKERLSIIGINKRATFSSTDIKVADVGPEGLVTAFRAGTTVIRAKTDGKVLKCRVTVVSLNKDSAVLKVGKKLKLSVKGAGFFASVFGLSFHSSNTKVATVTRYGTVKAVSKGKAVIEVKVRGKTLSCTVTVK